MDDLLSAIETELFETFVSVSVKLPYQQGQLISLFHEQGQVEKLENESGGVSIRGNLPVRLLTRFQPYLTKPINSE